MINFLRQQKKIIFSEIIFINSNTLLINNEKYYFEYIKEFSMNDNNIYYIRDSNNKYYVLKIIPKYKMDLDQFIDHIFLYYHLDKNNISAKFYCGIISDQTYAHVYEKYDIDLYEYFDLYSSKKKKIFINLNSLQNNIDILLDKILNVYNYTDIKLENILVNIDDYNNIIDVKFTDFELFEHVNDKFNITRLINKNNEIYFEMHNFKFNDDEIKLYKYFIKLNLCLSTLNILKKNKYNIDFPLFFNEILNIKYNDLLKINDFIKKYNNYLPSFFYKYIIYNIYHNIKIINFIIDKYKHEFNFINYDNFNIKMKFSELNYIWFIQLMILKYQHETKYNKSFYI